jgi:hypothetical protein
LALYVPSSITRKNGRNFPANVRGAGANLTYTASRIRHVPLGDNDTARLFSVKLPAQLDPSGYLLFSTPAHDRQQGH